MADIQQDLDFPIFDAGSPDRFEIGQGQARVHCNCDPDDWAIESVEIDGFGEDGKRRMRRIEPGHPSYSTIVAEAAKSDELDDKYTEFMWEHRRFGRTDREEHGQFGRTM